MIPEARPTGIPENRSKFLYSIALNQKAIARKASYEVGKK
jgi:butyrate kinase